ncbi:MAG: transposase [Bacteroides sp.]|nr:transposase [Bacteroides sp.]
MSGLRRRKSPRCDFHNYSGGDYFVTICTRDKEHFFGKIENGKMIFSEIGQVAYDRLATLSQHYEYLEVPVFVVMPNHIHAILCINGEDYNSVIPSQRTALSVIVGGYKQSVTSYARRNNIEFAWQNSYHDHIIRGTNDGNLIAEYIENNIIRWESDCFYPKLETY